jgi:hypothetical protein
MPLSCVTQLLQSDFLKVEDENTVLSFVYHYTKTQTNLACGISTANELSKCLRFNFLSLYNIMSSLRKCEALQLSEVYVDSIEKEF